MIGEKDLDRSWVGSDYREAVSTQSYAPGTRIEGVEIQDLRLMSDEGGDFCELARFTDGMLRDFPRYRPAQISYSFVAPGSIKGWHLHQRQDDLWFVPPHDRLLLGLLDVRKGSPTYNRSMRFVMGAGRARLLYIPRGVAHGAANLSTLPASIIYFTDEAFDLDNPDEHRLPYDVLGADFWTIQPG